MNILSPTEYKAIRESDAVRERERAVAEAKIKAVHDEAVLLLAPFAAQLAEGKSVFVNGRHCVGRVGHVVANEAMRILRGRGWRCGVESDGNTAHDGGHNLVVME